MQSSFLVCPVAVVVNILQFHPFFLFKLLIPVTAKVIFPRYWRFQLSLLLFSNQEAQPHIVHANRRGSNKFSSVNDRQPISTQFNMFIQDLKNDFYNILRGKRLLVIVNYDIDAICASKILQSLFRYDHMVYSIVPIMGMAGLQRAFNENKDDVKNILLINCGACIDLVELLEPDEDVTFFVCDSHRPLDICNVYSDSQVSEMLEPWTVIELIF